MNILDYSVLNITNKKIYHRSSKEFLIDFNCSFISASKIFVQFLKFLCISDSKNLKTFQPFLDRYINFSIGYQMD